MAIHFHKSGWDYIGANKNSVNTVNKFKKFAHPQYLILAIYSQFGMILQFFAFLTSFIAMGSLKRNIYF